MSRLVRCVTQKWPDRPHWEFDALWLGADGDGQWLGVSEGTWLERPGRGFHAAADHVVLVPHDAMWLATFYGNDVNRPVDTYVDITTTAEWEGDVVRCVDLDLDVIRNVDGRLWVDDEDEFARHQIEFDYPRSVVNAAERSAAEIFAAVEAGIAPFDRASALGWIAKLRVASGRS